MSIKRVISPTGRCSCVTKIGLLYVRRDPCGSIGWQCQNENREQRWSMFCMFWCWPGRSEGDTVDASDDDDADWLIYRGRRWCPWLIRESVRPTQWPWPAADMWLPAHSDCDSCQCLFMPSSLSMFFFLLQVYYWLGSGSSSGHSKLGTGPIPSSSMYIDHI